MEGQPLRTPVKVRDGNWVIEGEVNAVYSPPPPGTERPPVLGLAVNGRTVDDNRDGSIDSNVKTPANAPAPHRFDDLLRLVLVLVLLGGGIGGTALYYESSTRVTIGGEGIEHGSDGDVEFDGSTVGASSGDDVPSPDPEEERRAAVLASGDFVRELDATRRIVYIGRLATDVDATQARAFIGFQELSGEQWTLVDMRDVGPVKPETTDTPAPPAIPDGFSLVSDDELRIYRACRELLQSWQRTEAGSLHRRMYDNERAARDAALAGNPR